MASTLLRRALSCCTSPWATCTTSGSPARRHGQPLRNLCMNRAPSSLRSPAPVKFWTRNSISGDYRDRVSRLLPLRFVKATKFDYTARPETPRPPSSTTWIRRVRLLMGPVKFIYGSPNDYIRCGFRQVPLRMRQVRLHGPPSTSTDNPGHLRPCTTTVAENRQVYLYLVFGIAKNVKYPFEMTRSASSNDPKYLFETTEYYYHRTLERLLPLLPTTTAP